MNRTAFSERYGPWAIVTGASDGIGQAMAVEVASKGLNVILVARRKERLDELAMKLAQQFGVETLVLSIDLSHVDSTRLIEQATAQLDVGLLVAAAGYGTSGPFIGNELESETDMLRVNCLSLMQLSHLFGRRFAARGGGGLVLMSSLVGFQGVPYAANYAATKAYVQSLAEGLHVELAELGVDVLASAPGPIASGFAKRAKMQMGATQTPKVVAGQTLKALGRTSLVRPGYLAKLLELLLKTAPRRLRVRIMGRIMGDMTAHQARPRLTNRVSS